METKSLSQCGNIKSWGLFEVTGTDKRHIIGYSPAYGFDIITQELASFEFDKSKKSGSAITRSGIIYALEGKPRRINPKGHPQLVEFTEKHQCQINFIR